MVSKNLSVCLWSYLTPIISGLAEQNWLKNFLEHIRQNDSSQKILFVGKVPGIKVPNKSLSHELSSLKFSLKSKNKN